MSFNNLARFGPVVIFVLAVLVGLGQAKVTFYEHFGFQGKALNNSFYVVYKILTTVVFLFLQVRA